MKDLQNHIIQKISALLEVAKERVAVTVNQTMVLTYFEIGRMIVEEEQNGENRAEYGKALLKNISKELTQKFGRGFSLRNIEQMRQFYLSYSISKTVSAESNLPAFQKTQTVSAKFENTAYKMEQTRLLFFQESDNQLLEEKFETTSPKSEKGQIGSNESQSTENQEDRKEIFSEKFKLSWSHYLKLMRISDLNERNFYEIECFKNNWSLRELQRQYDSALYARLAFSKNKSEVEKLSKQGHIIQKPQDLIKDPYVLEFLGLPEKHFYSESNLEQKLIDQLEHFLLELGKGFTFVARQERISFDEKHFKIDLVFYNRILKSFVLIDLKIGELQHKDIGQMQMYVNYFDRERRLEDENKTIGIILCQDKSNALVEYTLPENNDQIFASKYMTVLPSKEELKKILTQS